MRLIVIEGCDGTGTTTHTQSLVYNLREEGYSATEFHHPPPPNGCSPWTRVTHYASERSKLVDRWGDSETVVVADRWHYSTRVFSAIVEDALRHRLLELARLEELTLPAPLMAVVLDASDVELDRRLTKRGEPLRATDALQRHAYRHVVGPQVGTILNTGQDKDAVRNLLLHMAVSAINK